MPRELPKGDIAIITRLNQIFALCEAAGLPGKNVDLDKAETQDVYLFVLKANRIDAEILNAGTADVLSERFFPTPGAIVDRCRPHRDAIEAERAANRMRGWVDCLDPRGGVMIAPPEMVLDGMPVAHGLGNGVAYQEDGPKSLDDSRLKALLDGRASSPMQLPGRTEVDRLMITPEKTQELIEEARRTAERNRESQ
jgi:hypothetical protein